MLMVCIGNICRSPLAEVCMKRALNQRRVSCEVTSAGLHALVGHPAAEHSLAIAMEHGMDLSAHRGRQLDAAMVRNHDLILVMEEEHIAMLLAMYPFARGRVYRLGHWHKENIDDPYRQPRESFERAYRLIERNVEAWVEKL